MLLYGLGLLGTQHFAPRSIVFLGVAFLGAGLLAMIGHDVAMERTMIGSNTPENVESAWLELGNMAMGITFGGFHIIYACCVWPRALRVPEGQGGAVDAGHAP